MKTLLIDIDGVACEHAEAICDRVNIDFRLNSKVEDVTTWDHDFGPITFKQAVDKYYQETNFVLNMEITPGFQSFLNEIKDIVKVKFATRRKHSKDESEKWIANMEAKGLPGKAVYEEARRLIAIYNK